MPEKGYEVLDIIVYSACYAIRRYPMKPNLSPHVHHLGDSIHAQSNQERHDAHHMQPMLEHENPPHRTTEHLMKLKDSLRPEGRLQAEEGASHCKRLAVSLSPSLETPDLEFRLRRRWPRVASCRNREEVIASPCGAILPVVTFTRTDLFAAFSNAQSAAITARIVPAVKGWLRKSSPLAVASVTQNAR